MSYRNLNRVVLIGRLTRDPDQRALPSGNQVCSLRIACNGSRREPDGSYSERPNFFDVDVYGVAADAVSRYTHTGSRVAVDGRLEWREWQTSDQQRRQAVSVIAESVQFLDAAESEAPGAAEVVAEEPEEEALAL
ncbi:MAG TPA: single-stranded DNA-binding protein [Solirubrobacteraceae bacterium]|jgi:single-strand DNA-binding protein|nr:single-stranded DNA-binding protein [Solirubrobacteraceae bacterium]